MVARLGSFDRWFAQARSAVGASHAARRNAGTCGEGLGAEDCALRMHAVPMAEPPRDPVALRAWGVRSPVRVAIAAGARSGPPLRSPRLFAAPVPASSTTFAQEAEDGGGATGADDSSACWPLPPECCDLSKGISVQPEGTPSDDGTSPSGEEDCASALEPEPEPEDEEPPTGETPSEPTPGTGGKWPPGGTGFNPDDWLPENWPGGDVPTGDTPGAPMTPNVPAGPDGTTGIDGGDGDDGDGDGGDSPFGTTIVDVAECRALGCPSKVICPSASRYLTSVCTLASCYYDADGPIITNTCNYGCADGAFAIRVYPTAGAPYTFCSVVF